MTLVVDASVALKWFLADEAYAVEAFSLVQAGIPLIAPDLLVAEVCNAAWRSARAGRIEWSELTDISRITPRFFDQLIGATILAPRAAIIARQLDHPIYDCLYVALAEAREIPLVTADTRLMTKLMNSAWAASAVPLAEYRIQP